MSDLNTDLWGKAESTPSEGSSADDLLWGTSKKAEAYKPEPKPSSPYERFKGVRDVASAGTAVADVAGGILGYAGGALGTAAGELGQIQWGGKGLPARGVPHPMQDIEQGALEGAQKPLLSNLAPGEREGLGYGAVMNKIMGPIGQALDLPGQGVKALAERGMLGSERTQPGQVGELQAGTNVGTMAATMALPIGLPKPKPGSMAWYNMLRKQATTSQDVSEAAFNRSMYPKPVETPVEPPKPAEPPPGGALQGSLFSDPESGIPSDARTPYNVPQAEQRRVSEEIRQATANHTQGDLFYQPHEDYKAVKEAEAKPGFLRDAIDKINLRFESIRQAEEANPSGQAKLNLEATSAKGEADDVTSAIDPIPVPKEVQLKAEDMVSRDVDARFTEYLPTGQVWLLRDHNRLTDPKSDHQFVGKEASVLKNGINMPLELKYSTVDGKAVLTNGNTRTSLAMKHGLPEIPVRVTVVDRPLAGTEAINGVEVGKFDLPKGDAKPSDIGLAGRMPMNKGKIGRQIGAIAVEPKQLKPEEGPRKPKDVLKAIERAQNTEIRPLSEVTQNMSRASIQDLDGPDHGSLVRDTFANLKNIGRHVLDATSVRHILEKTGLEPIFSWVNKNMINIDLFSSNMVKDILDGTKYARGRIDRLLGRGFEHRAATDGILPTLKSVPEGTEKTFLDKWFSMEGKEGKVTFDNPIHQRIYDSIQTALAKLHNMINEERLKLDLPKMAWLPNFFPHVREVGDYIVNVYDKYQQHMRFNMFQNFKDAKKAELALRAQFPEMDVRPAVHKQMNRWLSTDLDAIMEAARVNAQDHEVSKAMDKLIEQVVSKRGAGGHLLQRAKENIGGWLGENRSMPDVEKALTLYTNNAVTYVANLKRRGIQKSIEDLRFPSPEGADKAWRQNRATGGRYPDEPNRFLDIAPRAHSYLTDYISQSRGALQALDKLDKAFMGELGKGLQVGESGVMRKVYALNNLATVGYLSKTPFFISQFFQPILAIPRMMKLQNELGGGLSGMATTPFDFLIGYMHAIMPGLDTTGHSRGVVNYAIQRGMIDPTISHMLQASDTYGAWSKGFYTMTGAIEREVVRIPALLMIENSLRNVIKDPKQRYEVATAQMYRSMSGTTRSNTPLLYTKMGPIGASAKTMKSYATNYYGQFAEYAHDIAVADGTGEKLKALMPMGTFFGLSALFGGINGVVGFQEADAAITLFNTLTTSNVKTPREWIMTSGMSDSLVQQGMSPERARDINDIAGFGLASKMMPEGRDIQAQVGNPPTTSILSIVPYKVPIDVATGLFPFIVAAAEGKMTDAILMQTLEHLTLNNPHARTAIEAWFQQQGRNVPRAYMNMAGNFTRDTPEYWKTALSGMNTLDEKRADMALQFTKRHLSRLEKDRSEMLHSMVDSLLRDKSSPTNAVDRLDMGQKLQSYLSQGGNASSMKQDLKNAIIQRSLTGMDYQMVKGAKGGGAGYAKKLDELQQYQSMLPQPKTTPNDMLWGPETK